VPSTGRAGPPRADAVRNRAHILAVAQEAFAADGGVSLNEIAKRAGIGAGTLYRHFPTREDLVLAVYRDEVLRLSDSVTEVLAAHADPVDAFRTWYETLARSVRVKHGLGEALTTAAARSIIGETYAPVLAATRALLDACAATGAMRADVEAGDVLMLMGFLWRLPDDAAGRRQAARTMDIVVAGLRPGG
jgi:AcrR family transcriptional regulator